YRLSKELNDGVIQDLFAAGMLMGSATGLSLPPEEQRLIQTVEKQLQGVVDRLRLYVMDLEPASPDEREVQVGLRITVDEFRANTLLPVILDVDPDVTLGDAATRSVLSVVSEALSNIRRHAQASLVRLSLRKEGTALRLTVTDNGRGLAAGSFSNGLGMDHMLRAAEAAGGRLTIGPAPGGGTRVILELPDFLQDNTKHP
ncbi:MAG TPA: ATP-binding protein, partial [Symbiobacteriaceae bacterium]|nr:ATP-binding protein [Symbiobacteriaceae bacterium]